MSTWHLLDLITISEAVKKHSDANFKNLMRSICIGETALYLPVPSDCVVVPYPNEDQFIEIPELRRLYQKQSAEPVATKVIISETYPPHKPDIVQIKPEIATRFAEELLFRITVNGMENIEFPEFRLNDHAFLDLTGTPVMVGETPHHTGWLVSRIKSEYPKLLEKYPDLERDAIFIRPEIFSTEFGDVAVSIESLFNPVSDFQKSATESPLRNSPPALHPHPAMDPSHPKYAPELHAALAAWEAIYGEGKDLESKHTPYVKKWLKDNWERSFQKNASTRIARLINHEKNKNDGKFTEK